MRWSLAVAEAWGKCPHCNSEACSAHHVIGRVHQKTRYVLENGLFCCNELHRQLEGRREQEMKLLEFYFGLEKYKNLKKISRGLALPSDFNFTVIE